MQERGRRFTCIRRICAGKLPPRLKPTQKSSEVLNVTRHELPSGNGEEFQRLTPIAFQEKAMLARMQKSMKDKDQGFTLIELLVVIVIIGILAAIAIPVFLNQRKKGVDAGLRADLRHAATVAETITVDAPTRTTPFTAAELIAAGFKGSPGNVFEYSGSPAAGNFCASGHNPGGTTTKDTAEYKYDAQAGGMQPGLGAKC